MHPCTNCTSSWTLTPILQASWRLTSWRSLCTAAAPTLMPRHWTARARAPATAWALPHMTSRVGGWVGWAGVGACHEQVRGCWQAPGFVAHEKGHMLYLAKQVLPCLRPARFIAGKLTAVRFERRTLRPQDIRIQVGLGRGGRGLRGGNDHGRRRFWRPCMLRVRVLPGAPLYLSLTVCFAVRPLQIAYVGICHSGGFAACLPWLPAACHLPPSVACAPLAGSICWTCARCPRGVLTEATKSRHASLPAPCRPAQDPQRVGREHTLPLHPRWMGGASRHRPACCSLPLSSALPCRAASRLFWSWTVFFVILYCVAWLPFTYCPALLPLIQAMRLLASSQRQVGTEVWAAAGSLLGAAPSGACLSWLAWLALHPFVVQYDNRPPGTPACRGLQGRTPAYVRGGLGAPCFA